MLPGYFILFSSYRIIVCKFMKITFETLGNKGDFIYSKSSDYLTLRSYP